MSKADASKPKEKAFRFYEKELPEVDDLVMVRVTSVEETAAYAHLLEYENIQGMIPTSEVTRQGRVRSLAQHIKKGGMEVVQVLRVDKVKRYIDLSKKKVSREEFERCEDYFNKARQVQQILGQVASQTNTTLEELCTSISWPLYKKYPHAYDALREAVTDFDKVFEGIAAPKPVLEAIEKLIQHKLRTKTVQCRQEIKAICHREAGIDAIKAALLAGLASNQNDGALEVRITVQAAPTYIIFCDASDEAEGTARIREVIDIVTRELTAAGGMVEVAAKQEQKEEGAEK